MPSRAITVVHREQYHTSVLPNDLTKPHRQAGLSQIPETCVAKIAFTTAGALATFSLYHYMAGPTGTQFLNVDGNLSGF